MQPNANLSCKIQIPLLKSTVFLNHVSTAENDCTDYISNKFTSVSET